MNSVSTLGFILLIKAVFPPIPRTLQALRNNFLTNEKNWFLTWLSVRPGKWEEMSFQWLPWELWRVISNWFSTSVNRSLMRRGLRWCVHLSRHCLADFARPCPLMLWDISSHFISRRWLAWKALRTSKSCVSSYLANFFGPFLAFSHRQYITFYKSRLLLFERFHDRCTLMN